MTSTRYLVLVTLLVAACGDNGMQTPPPTPDGSDVDAAPADAAIDAAPAAHFIAATAGAEPTIAADGQGMVVASWIDTGSGNANAYAISHDDGVTWGQVLHVEPASGPGTGDVVLTTDPSGNFYIAFLGFDVANSQLLHVWAAKLDRTTGNFLTAIDISGAGNVDKPWITALHNGTVVVTWSDIGNSAIYAATSADQGATYTPHVVRSGGFGNLLFPCSDPTVDGPLYIAFSVVGGIGMRKSMDNGVTWGSVPSPANDAAFQDPTCAVHGDNVWVVYAPGSFNTSQQQTTAGDAVILVKSTDGAATWTRLAINDTASTDKYLFPQLARGANGHLHVVWYEGVVNMPATLVDAVSTDDGATWTRRVIETPGTFITNRTVINWLGDYFGVYAAGTGIYMAYPDNSAATHRTHIAFAKTPQ